MASASGNAQITTAPGGGLAAYFNGSGDYVTPGFLSQNIFGDLSLPWTFEYEFYVTGRYASGMYPTIFSNELASTTRYTVFLAGAGSAVIPYFCCFNNNVQQYVGSASVSANAWHTIAIVCGGNGSMAVFSDGIKGTPAIFTNNNPNSTIMTGYKIGNGVNYPDNYVGYLRNMRFTRGIARYSANYTPAAFEVDPISSRVGKASISFIAKDLDFSAGPSLIAGKPAGRVNLDFAGAGAINGVTQVQTGPTTILALGNCDVLLFDRQTQRLVARTRSNASGLYTFINLNPARAYYATAFDPSGQYDAVSTQNLQVIT